MKMLKAHGLHSDYGAWCGVFALFLCVNVITSCGTLPLPTAHIQLEPQSTEGAQSFHTTVKTFDGVLTVLLNITPNRSGANVFTARVMDTRNGKPATSVVISLYTTMQDMSMGTASLLLRDDGQGQFSATSDILSMAGHWAIGITILTPDHTLHKAGVTLLLSP